jgi:transcriptional repressor NrdR
LQVVDTREAADATRRRRACQDCGHRFTTYERRDIFACPHCGHDEARIESWELTSQGAMRRHRRCADCGLGYQTLERLARMDIRVLKDDGRSEPFNRGKLYRSIMIAGTKRPVTSSWAEEVAIQIENDLIGRDTLDIPSKQIADQVMERLVTLDEVTYVRYASGYFGEGGIQEMLDSINDSRRRREQTEIERTNLPLVPADADDA